MTVRWSITTASGSCGGSCNMNSFASDGNIMSSIFKFEYVIYKGKGYVCLAKSAAPNFAEVGRRPVLISAISLGSSGWTALSERTHHTGQQMSVPFEKPERRWLKAHPQFAGK